MTTLYQAHLAILVDRYENAMAHFGLDAIVLASGKKVITFRTITLTHFTPILARNSGYLLA